MILAGRRLSVSVRAVAVRAPGALERTSTRTLPPPRGAIGRSTGASTSRRDPAAESDADAVTDSWPASCVNTSHAASQVTRRTSGSESLSARERGGVNVTLGAAGSAASGVPSRAMWMRPREPSPPTSDQATAREPSASSTGVMASMSRSPPPSMWTSRSEPEKSTRATPGTIRQMPWRRLS